MDLTTLSDEQLNALEKAQKVPLSQLSDEELGHLEAAHSGRPASPSIMERGLDIYKGLDVGATKGGASLLGAAGDITNLGAKGIGAASDWISQKLGLPAYQPTSQGPIASFLQKNIPTSESMTKEFEQRYGKPYEPKYEAGKTAESIGEFVPGALAAAATGGASLPTALTRYAAVPGLTTKVAQTALPESEFKPYLVAGAGALSSTVNPARAITPFPNAARQASVEALAKEGVTSLTAGQKTGHLGLRNLEEATSAAPLAGNRAAEITGEGQRQFTEAVMRRAGAGPNALPEVLGPNYERLGNAFQDLAARNTLIPDNKFVGDVVQAVKDYKNVPPSQQRAMVEGYLNDITAHVNKGQMPGEAYQEMRSRLSRQANSLKQSDPTLSGALRDIRDALDNGMGRSISPADREAWKTVREQYGAQKVIEKAASRAGEATSEGQITPANLRNIVSAENRGAYARGGGPFAELARAGANVMTPLPNSGTAQKLNAFRILDTGLLGIPQALTGRALMSAPVQNALANQLVQGGALPSSSAARNLLLMRLLQQTQQPSQQMK